MAKSNTCCFTGHRVLPRDFTSDCLMRGIEYLINQGVDTFITGGAIGFDTKAAQAVLEAKKKYPNIKLHIYVPCRNQDKKWNIKDKIAYQSLLKKADHVDINDKEYYDGCMLERNRKMVDASSYCIAYYNGSRSGTGSAVAYAKKQGVTVFNIYNKE
ncbi:MAG: DUF1273 family protein [Clostridia bacterium]|nr:DUF1273 family protein [Clostridia bacterium]